MKNFEIANVIDLELTCYPDGIFPAGETREIIEVGLCELNLRTLTIKKTHSFPVIPTSSSVSPYCTELTGWTMSALKKHGFSYEKVCRLLAKYGARNRLFISDSDDEAARIDEQCKRMGLENPLGDAQFNVATLFALLTMQSHNIPLDQMLSHFGMTFEGRPHRASFDAMNIARLFIKLMETGRHGMVPFLQKAE